LTALLGFDDNQVKADRLLLFRTRNLAPLDLDRKLALLIAMASRQASGSRKRAAGGVRLVALTAALAACSDMRSDDDRSQPVAGLCAPIPPVREKPAENAYEQAIQRDECIHRYAYLFARARDDADAVVGAVIGACRGPIDRSATMLGAGDPQAERWYLTEMERVARERALYRVIQARAGHCS
jgi:hypothetical protein